jgi:hypothetical protein
MGFTSNFYEKSDECHVSGQGIDKKWPLVVPVQPAATLRDWFRCFPHGGTKA